MKQKYKFIGCDTGRLRNGSVHDIEVIETTKKVTVNVNGTGFNYTITYKNIENFNDDWSKI